MPSASAVTAPSDAPEDTPSVEPSASGLRRSPCMAAPHRESAAPVSATHSTRGSRTEKRTALGKPPGRGSPQRAFHRAVRVEESGMDTLPTQTHSSIVSSRIRAAASHRRKEEQGRFIIIAAEPPGKWKKEQKGVSSRRTARGSPFPRKPRARSDAGRPLLRRRGSGLRHRRRTGKGSRQRPSDGGRDGKFHWSRR